MGSGLETLDKSLLCLSISGYLEDAVDFIGLFWPGGCLVVPNSCDCCRAIGVGNALFTETELFNFWDGLQDKNLVLGSRGRSQRKSSQRVVGHIHVDRMSWKSWPWVSDCFISVSPQQYDLGDITCRLGFYARCPAGPETTSHHDDEWA